MFERFRSLRAVLRSLRTYYGNRPRRVAMDRLYGQFIHPGDLAFDVGAHVGDRVASFRRLGARVVAVEPQPALLRILRLFYGRKRDVVIEAVLLGASIGRADFRINVDNPTISTASSAFVDAADGAPGWEGQRWTRTVRMPVTTLDALIARHGVPAFIKIDVEGFEADVLAGLTNPIKALSFEFTTIQRDIAHRCVERCAALGFSTFNAALGETQMLVAETWMSAQEIRRWIDELPHSANSGDIYAHA
jgi:FkbM family methyltransferase